MVFYIFIELGSLKALQIIQKYLKVFKVSISNITLSFQYNIL